jgi:hypothetical protein
MIDSNTIRTKSKDPGGGVVMLKEQYMTIKTFLLEVLAEETISTIELMNKCYEHFHPVFQDSTGMLVYNVKIDLEVRGLIFHHKPLRRRALPMVSKVKNK